MSQVVDAGLVKSGDISPDGDDADITDSTNTTDTVCSVGREAPEPAAAADSSPLINDTYCRLLMSYIYDVLTANWL